LSDLRCCVVVVLSLLGLLLQEHLRLQLPTPAAADDAAAAAAHHHHHVTH
jgi:hypothetical protein